jgi:hypothetical protein
VVSCPAYSICTTIATSSSGESFAPALFHRDQLREQVLARLRAALGDHLGHVLVERDDRAIGLGARLGRRRRGGERERRGPLADRLVVDRRDREQPADHLQREPLRERVVEIDLADRERLVEQVLRDPLGDRAHARDLTRRERAREQTAQPVVVGRIEEHHRPPHPVDVGPARPALLLVVAHADRAEPAVEQRLHHVRITQEDHRAELGHARRAHARAQERPAVPCGSRKKRSSKCSSGSASNAAAITGNAPSAPRLRCASQRPCAVRPGMARGG